MGKLHLARKFRIANKANKLHSWFAESEFRINGVVRPDASFLKNAFRILYLTGSKDPERIQHGDLPEKRFWDIAARFLGFNSGRSDFARKSVWQIIQKINQREDRLFRNVTLHEGRLYLQHWENDSVFPYLSSGSGDKVYLFSDFALEASALIAQYSQVLLLLDNFPTAIAPAQRFARRYRDLASPKHSSNFNDGSA